MRVSRETDRTPSLADAEIPENDVEQILDVNPPGQPTQGIRRLPQFLGPKLQGRRRVHRRSSSASRHAVSARPMAGPGDQGRFARFASSSRANVQRVPAPGRRSLRRSRPTTGRRNGCAKPRSFRHRIDQVDLRPNPQPTRRPASITCARGTRPPSRPRAASTRSRRSRTRPARVAFPRAPRHLPFHADLPYRPASNG